jgi:thioesterase domain-containing protein
LSVLFQAPTVEKLADLVRKDGWRPNWTSLVPIQPGGSKPPFFCVHGGGGNVLIYRELARHLGADYPFYGLQARGLDGNTDYLTTTQAMAESYLQEIRELQPEGPYYLGGFCMGGQVAVEIAQRLVRDGQRVNLLFLIDTHNFNGVPARSAQVKNERYPGPVFCLGEKSKIALRREFERLRIRIVHLLKLKPHRDVMGPREEFLERINDRAFLAYKPDVYPGKMTVCKPQRKYAFQHDPFNGWREVAAGGLDLIALPVDPDGIFIDPFVPLLAVTLRESLDQAFSVIAQAFVSENGATPSPNETTPPSERTQNSTMQWRDCVSLIGREFRKSGREDSSL